MMSIIIQHISVIPSAKSLEGFKNSVSMDKTLSVAPEKKGALKQADDLPSQQAGAHITKLPNDHPYKQYRHKAPLFILALIVIIVSFFIGLFFA